MKKKDKFEKLKDIELDQSQVDFKANHEVLNKINEGLHCLNEVSLAEVDASHVSNNRW
jgi:hypothetical protein